MILSVVAFIVWPNAPGVTAKDDVFALVQENTAGFVLPVVGPIFAFLSMPILAVWFILLARNFFRLAQ